MASINTNRQLGINQDNASKSLEKLSSGSRINKAGDDAAGLAISEKMRGQIRGLDQASRNSQDGISMIQTAEGSLSETQSILQRMKELATQSANDTNVAVDRGEIQKEMNQLTSEINRIGNTTEFNTQKLLKGKDVKVVATPETIATNTAGIAGVPVGTTSDLKTNSASVVAVASTGSVQGNTAAATGKVGTTDQTTVSVKGATSAAIVSGLSFTSTTPSVATPNGGAIQINQVAGTIGSPVASSITTTGTGSSAIIKFNIGTDAAGKSLFTGTNRGELANFLKGMDATNYATSGVTISVPEAPNANGPASAEKLINMPDRTKIATASTIYSGALAGGVAETVGVSTFSIATEIKEAGDTITVGGKTFTAKTDGADATKGEFNIGSVQGSATATAAASLTTNFVASVTKVALAATAAAAGVSTSGAATFTFKGVTVTLDAAHTADAAHTTAGAVATASATAVSVGIATGGTATNAVDAIVAGFNAVKAADTTGALAHYTITNNAGQLTFTGDGTQGTADNTQALTVGGTDVGTGNSTVAAPTTLGIDSQLDISIATASAANTYSLKSADLAKFDGTLTQEQALTIIKGATNASGIALSTVADVSFNSDGKLNVISKAGGAGKDVTIAAKGYTDVAHTTTSAADTAAVNAVFGTTTTTNIAGANTGATAADQARSLQVAINADPTLGAHYSAVANTGVTGGIKMTEKANQGTGVSLATVTTAGSGADDKLNITDLSGKNLSQITIIKGSGTAVAAVAAKSNQLDTSLQLTSGTSSAELNGVKVSFSGLTSGTSTALTSTWDAENQTMNVTGSILAAETNTGFQTALQNELRTGMINAGFSGAAQLAVTAGASGTAATLTTALNGNSMTFGGDGVGTNGTTGVAGIAAHAMVVDQKDGNLTITLSDTITNNNTATKIQAAVQALGLVKTSSGDVDFSKYQFTAGGDWDTKSLGENTIKSNTTLVGGTNEVKGDYSFDITKAFAVGDKVNVKGQIFTAVASGAIGSKNQFDVSSGDVNNQAISLRNAIGLNSTLSTTYTVDGTGATIKMKELQATGVDIKATDLAVKGTGTAGEYSIDTSKLQENGAAFVIDGKEIAVSSKNTNVGYDKGTAIKVATTAAGQTAALVDAINKNADLKTKYTASVGTDGNLVLKQNEMQESATAPVVATKNSSIGEFTATLQIGANAGQSMTVNVNDMRSTAIGVSGDGSVDTVAGKDGKVASYVKVANVTNGTDNTSVEFSLDVSDHTKATNAVSVIGDAIEAVSAERSKLGAFQNRLDHTISNLGTTSENMTAAESRIRDVDMAKEMMTFQKNNILQQAATAMMAQANKLPEGVLQLLR